MENIEHLRILSLIKDYERELSKYSKFPDIKDGNYILEIVDTIKLEQTFIIVETDNKSENNGLNIKITQKNIKDALKLKEYYRKLKIYQQLPQQKGKYIVSINDINVNWKNYEGMTENNKLISILLPTYNRGNKCIRTIQNVLQQTYPYFELIIINDGSDKINSD